MKAQNERIEKAVDSLIEAIAEHLGGMLETGTMPSKEEVSTLTSLIEARADLDFYKQRN